MITPEQLHILQHSLGVDKYGQGEQYRNHYAVGPGCDSYEDCQALTAIELMEDSGPQSLAGGMHYFRVTEKGRTVMLLESPAAPKLTQSQKRYRQYLKADVGMRFGDWLKRGKAA